MKRNKIFLGVTASLLAVVGFAAAHQHKHTQNLFYTTANGNLRECDHISCSKLSALGAYSTIGSSSIRLQTTANSAGRFNYKVCYTTTSGTCIEAFRGL